MDLLLSGRWIEKSEACECGLMALVMLGGLVLEISMFEKSFWALNYGGGTVFHLCP